MSDPYNSSNNSSNNSLRPPTAPTFLSIKAKPSGNCFGFPSFVIAETFMVFILVILPWNALIMNVLTIMGRSSFIVLPPSPIAGTCEPSSKYLAGTMATIDDAVPSSSRRLQAIEFIASTFVSRSPSGARSVHGSSQSTTGVWYPVTTLTALTVGGRPDRKSSRPAVRDSNSSSARAKSASNRSPTDRGDMVRSTQPLNSVTSACLLIIADWSPRFIAR
mmetsp:Transcript_16241/g.37564  ORF Transcript_16241/g.37564 Transcript_16241/m.37564 type:complete len:219 (-) Transcript_16241:174-830(-)